MTSWQASITQDKVRPDSKAALAELVKRIKPIMLTGDNKRTAEVVAKQVA